MCVSRKPSPLCWGPIQNVGRGRNAVADGVAVLHDAGTAEGGEDGVVENGTAAEAGALDGDVGEHPVSLPARPVDADGLAPAA
jgi:hypothetical protein